MSRGFPSMTALLALLAIAGYQNRDKIAEMLRGAKETNPGAGEQGGLGGLLGQLGLGGASAGGILLRVLARLEDNRAEAVLRAVKQNSVPESMRHRHIDYRSGRELPEL